VAADCLQVNSLRRSLLLASTALPVACVSSQPYLSGSVVAQPVPIPVVRAPMLGQEWVYQVRNVFNQAVVDVVTEKVASIGEVVRISRVGLKAGVLPDEIQSSWGYVTQDPHWNPPQKFQEPLPLWPQQLTVGWNTFLRTRYHVLGYPDSSYYWGLSMKAIQWEKIAVPAGEFTALEFHNEAPFFESNDLFRLASMRQEDIWFAPEIGRWAIRRGYGRYLLGGITWNNALWEDYLEWELLSWK